MTDRVASSLQVAAASVDLTPPAGLPLGGYVLREGKVSTGAHDPLLGSLVWVRDPRPDGGEVLWVALDALAVDADLASRIAAAVAAASGCAAEAILVCASHTHSSAAGWLQRLGPFSAETGDEGLRSRLVEQLGGAARTLRERLEPCRAVLSARPAAGAGGNRNDPAGPHDASVGVLGLVDEAGRLAALVVDYASHATVLGHANLAWSADWPGATRRALGLALAGLAPFEPAGSFAERSRSEHPDHRDPVIAFLQGAAGDASPRFVRRNQGYAEVDRLGALVAAAALAGLLAAEPVPGPLAVSVRRGQVELATRHLPEPERAEANARQAEAAWHEAQEKGAAPADERVARTRYEGAMLLAAASHHGLPPTEVAPMAAVTIGDAAWVHLPVELFASFGLAIRKASPHPWTRVVGYTDAYLGYLADAPAHRSGVYEAFASHFDADAGERLRDEALGLLGGGS